MFQLKYATFAVCSYAPEYQVLIEVDDPIAKKIWHQKPGYRIAILIGGLTALMVTMKLTGVADGLNLENVRTYLLDSGPAGVIAYLVVFAVSNLLSVPGVIFIVAAMLVYGKLLGTLLAILGAICSVTLSFFVVRKIGGTPVGELKAKWARKMLRYLDQYPIRTIIVLRTFLLLNPHLNYILALSTVRFRSYFIGSALGLILPIGFYAVGLEFFFSEYLGSNPP